MTEIRRLFLSSGEISLTRLVPTDARWLETWVNDPITTRFMATGRTQMNPAQLAAQIDAWKEPTDWPFAIVLEGYQDPIGTVGLYGVDWLSRKAEFRVLIGEIYCGKGHGTVATKLALRFAFDRLQLHRVWLGVTASNERAIRAYKRAGFSNEGLLRDDLYRDGQYHHSRRMGIVQADYERMREIWDTEKAKPLGTLEPGLDIPRPADEP